jgi:hypothetical protein
MASSSGEKLCKLGNDYLNRILDAQLATDEIEFCEKILKGDNLTKKEQERITDRKIMFCLEKKLKEQGMRVNMK